MNVGENARMSGANVGSSALQRAIGASASSRRARVLLTRSDVQRVLRRRTQQVDLQRRRALGRAVVECLQRPERSRRRGSVPRQSAATRAPRGPRVSTPWRNGRVDWPSARPARPWPASSGASIVVGCRFVTAALRVSSRRWCRFCSAASWLWMSAVTRVGFFSLSDADGCKLRVHPAEHLARTPCRPTRAGALSSPSTNGVERREHLVEEVTPFAGRRAGGPDTGLGSGHQLVPGRRQLLEAVGATGLLRRRQRDLDGVNLGVQLGARRR